MAELLSSYGCLIEIKMLISVIDIYSCIVFGPSFFLILRQINVRHSFIGISLILT